VKRQISEKTAPSCGSQIQRSSPAAMMPNKRLACSVENLSAMKLQKTETTNKLYTLAQLKKILATQACWILELNNMKNNKI
jgi:hypothetical protein